MKKILLLVVAACLLLGAAAPAFAQTTSVSTQLLIQNLQQQLATLQAQFQALVQAQFKATSNAVAQTTAQLERNLHEGMSGDDVKTLQAILSKDPDIFPEGLITGFFGKATARAVARFQARENLPSVGLVGPRTLEKLSRELEKEPLGDEEDNEKDNGEKRPCAIVPPGHLIAPGWLRKHDGVRPIVPICQKLPVGIEGQMGTTLIFDVAARAITNTSAHVTWDTNTRATGVVWYSTVSPVVRTSSTLKVSSSVLEREHNLALTGLSSNTTYYYVVESTDEDGHMSVSAEHSFTTSQTIDTTPPVVFNIAVGGLTTTSAHIMWTTNETATGKVWYSVNSPVSSGNGTLSANASFTTSHDFTLSGLNASTTYYYVVESSDASGNTSVSAQQSFTTSLQTADTMPPVLTGVTVSAVTGSSARIVWTTDKMSDSTVWYSTTAPITVTASTPMVTSATLTLSHDLTISGLAHATTYYYMAGSKDASGNLATSAQYFFTTLGQ